MGRLFLKLYSILIIAVALYFVGIANLDSLIEKTLERYYSGLAKGTFYLIESRLDESPKAMWTSLVDDVNRGEGYEMGLISLASLRLSREEMERLNRGEIIISETYDASYAYQRIRNSDWVLAFPFEETEYSDNQRLSNSTFNLIEMRLQTQPQNRWPDMVAELAGHFNFPLVLLHLKQVKLAPRLQEALAAGEIVWEYIDDNTDYLYRRLEGSPYVIKMGPFKAPLTLSYLEAILMMVLGVLVAFAVLFWVYPLWRDLKRLSVSAEALGQGDFTVRASLGKRSVLRHLAETFNGMACRIQGLISSHKELTNAVSHELRTPIARLRFGIEMMSSSRSEADRSRYIQSMNADIDELDQLVAELLTYARFDRDKPELVFQRQQVEPWLSDVIGLARRTRDERPISYTLAEEAPLNACFEPRLMARAVGNLLQNAVRYAKTRVHVTFSYDEGCYQIAVDDDGPGIPEAEREGVFEAFKRLDASRDRGTGGYGLGLAIVQRIVQWHGGQVLVKRSALGGSRFVIRWPEHTLSSM